MFRNLVEKGTDRVRLDWFLFAMVESMNRTTLLAMDENQSSQALSVMQR